nr:DUF485 domain-containing protein [Paenibacillus beijingensis]
MTLFFFTFYFSLPLLASYSKVLNTPIVGPIPLAWFFAFCQFIMTWTLCIVYTQKSKQFDSMVIEIKKCLMKGDN